MMAYANNYVVSIIVNGKAIREFNEKGLRTCTIPFDTEYMIRLKNKTGLKAKVKIDIDGTDVLDGKAICLDPYETMDLERFLVEGGRKFRFISQEKAAITGELGDPDEPENGVVNIRFYQERPTRVTTCGSCAVMDDDSYLNRPMNFDSTLRSERGIPISTTLNHNTKGITATGNVSDVTHAYFAAQECTPQPCSAELTPDPVAVAGITGEGGKSNQRFKTVAYFEVDPTPTQIKIKLKGRTATKLVGVYLDGSRHAAFSGTMEEATTWIKNCITVLSHKIEIKEI